MQVKMRYSPVARIGAFYMTLIWVRFLLDKYPTWGILIMKTYSISEAARILGVDRKTLRRWIERRLIPTPMLGISEGRPAKVWKDHDLTLIRNYMRESYWGKGVDRRTGKKSKKQKKQ
jgi:excisionase family DNA binding protein